MILNVRLDESVNQIVKTKSKISPFKYKNQLKNI